MTVTRLLAADDASALAHLLRRNRTFPAPWQPKRADGYFSDEAQHEAVGTALLQYQAGGSVPLVVTGEDDALVGAITLQSIIRGAFQSCSVAYWLSEDVQGRGLATDALRDGTEHLTIM